MPCRLVALNLARPRTTVSCQLSRQVQGYLGSPSFWRPIFQASPRWSDGPLITYHICALYYLIHLQLIVSFPPFPVMFYQGHVTHSSYSSDWDARFGSSIGGKKCVFYRRRAPCSLLLFSNGCMTEEILLSGLPKIWMIMAYYELRTKPAHLAIRRSFNYQMEHLQPSRLAHERLMIIKQTVSWCLGLRTSFRATIKFGLIA